MKMLVKKNFIFSLLIVSFLALSACTSAPKHNLTIATDKTVDIKEWKTGNGVRVLYVYAPGLPMVDVQAIFDAGSVRDGDKPGIATLTGGMLSHGARLGNKKLSVDEITERFES